MCTTLFQSLDLIQKLAVAGSVAGTAFLALALKRRNESLAFAHFPTLPEEALPGMSVVVAAKDEAETIGEALGSLLSLDYPDLEVILVEDRSTDRTYEVAAQVKEEHPQGHRLRLLRCRELPEGWLGKVHALHLGSKLATKPLILLTDADVHFEAESLKRAASIQQILQCDHLVAAPLIDARGFWEPVLVAFFLLMFTIRFQPNRVHKDKKSYVGVGAFNLLTRETMKACQFLEPLRLQITDDVHLGRLVKSLGREQYCVIAEDQIRVRWFEGLKGCILGLEKNAYAGLYYSLPMFWASLPLVAMPLVLPLALVGLGYPALAALYLLFLTLTGAVIPKACRLPRWVGLFFPLAAGVLVFTFSRSVWLAETRKGVRWRDTHYALDDLRAEHWAFLNEKAPL